MTLEETTLIELDERMRKYDEDRIADLILSNFYNGLKDIDWFITEFEVKDEDIIEITVIKEPI